MKRTVLIVLALISLSISFMPVQVSAVQSAPHITDREIVERLTRLEEGQKSLEKRFDLLRDDLNKRFDDMNRRFDMLMWLVGLFTSLVAVTLGFVIRIQWQMNKRLSGVEATIEVQRDEIRFLKDMVAKLIAAKS